MGDEPQLLNTNTLCAGKGEGVSWLWWPPPIGDRFRAALKACNPPSTLPWVVTIRARYDTSRHRSVLSTRRSAIQPSLPRSSLVPGPRALS